MKKEKVYTYTELVHNIDVKWQELYMAVADKNVKECIRLSMVLKWYINKLNIKQ